MCRLPQHRTLYTRVLSKLNCPLANTRTLGKVDCSSAHLWTREELEGTPSDQRVGNYFPATIIFLLALPHIWCTTFRNRGYPLSTPPNLPGFIGATAVPLTIHSAGSVWLLTHSGVSLLVAAQTNDARTFESSKSMVKSSRQGGGLPLFTSCLEVAFSETYMQDSG